MFRGREELGEPGAGPTGWVHLAERLGALSRSLRGDEGTQAVLAAVARAAVDTVPTAGQAGIASISRRLEVRTLAATGDLPRLVDEVQQDIGEGPCIDGLYDQPTVRLSDLGAETPWPKFAATVREVGVGSLLAVRIQAGGPELVALTVCSTRPGAFDDASEQVGRLVAANAAVALAGAQEKEHLQTALRARDVIGQAKGILMERYKIDADEAFRMLVTASQTTNVKLRDIAAHLAATGTLDPR